MRWIVDTLTLADARRLDTLWRARCAAEGLAQAEIDAAAQFTSHRLVDFDEDRRRGRWILLGVADLDGHLAGYLSAMLIPRLNKLLGNVYIDEVYVLPEVRRQGAGRALVTGLVEIARRRGVSRVQAALDPEVEGIEGLYQACGFKTDIVGWGSYPLEQ